MELNATEFYVIYQALLARRDWISDDAEAPEEEMPFIESALEKISNLKIDIKLKK
jgi:hypothetical protein